MIEHVLIALGCLVFAAIMDDRPNQTIVSSQELPIGLAFFGIGIECDDDENENNVENENNNDEDEDY